MATFLLPGLGVALSCGLGAMMFAEPPHDFGPRLACPLLQPHQSKADRIEITHDHDVLWLERRGAVWGLARQDGYPVRQGAADRLLDALGSARLQKPAAAQGDADETTVRVLAQSGAALCSIAVRAPPSAILRRTGDKGDWVASVPIPLFADPAQWSQTSLPPIDPAEVTSVSSDGRIGEASLEQALTHLPFTDVRARPQVRAQTIRTIEIAMKSGTAVLTVGVLDHRCWLTVSGTSRWAQALAPYAFALPPDSILATM